MALEAKPDCCQEAAMGMGDAYFPCNKPAVKVIGWKGRTDQPLRMCEGCADHNVKNRGGYEVSVYPIPSNVETQQAPTKKRTRKPTQKTDYTADQIKRHEESLSKTYFVILNADAAGESYKQIAGRIGVESVGTVKSRLHRARAELAALIKAATAKGANAEPNTNLGAG